jgi:hypothetical protein
MEGKWRKSSYSQGGDANCVELAPGHQGLLVRDSKAPRGAMLTFTGGAASAFLSGVKVGMFDR